MLMNSSEYLATIEQVKQEIKAAQYKAAVHINTELIMLYSTSAASLTHIKAGAANSLIIWRRISRWSFRSLQAILSEI